MVMMDVQCDVLTTIFVILIKLLVHAHGIYTESEENYVSYILHGITNILYHPLYNKQHDHTLIEYISAASPKGKQQQIKFNNDNAR